MQNCPSTTRFQRSRGIALFEVTLALAALVILALVALKASLNVVEAQRWAIVQALSDAYLTREVALASRIPYPELVAAADSPWPSYPVSSETEIELGKLPGAIPVAANLVRTKYPARQNLVSKGGESTEFANPTRMETWLVKSFVTYQVAGREYVKSRTTVRVR